MVLNFVIVSQSKGAVLCKWLRWCINQSCDIFVILQGIYNLLIFFLSLSHFYKKLGQLVWTRKISELKMPSAGCQYIDHYLRTVGHASAMYVFDHMHPTSKSFHMHITRELLPRSGKFLQGSIFIDRRSLPFCKLKLMLVDW